jgi:POT family proton-dependent oligopeptide transporter
MLALVSRVAPPQVNSFMMGIVFTSLFLGNILTGWAGSLYEKMTPTEFWALHAAIGATGGLLVLLFGSRLERALRSEQS